MHPLSKAREINADRYPTASAKHVPDAAQQRLPQPLTCIYWPHTHVHAKRTKNQPANSASALAVRPSSGQSHHCNARCGNIWGKSSAIGDRVYGPPITAHL
mmetsp:Transcript_17432/g.44631  ORF Transcript_17432/g.44631 Transcript_17432/m.44631 type:complete len:101 (-) Transcript_17432:129-431(-)